MNPINGICFTEDEKDLVSNDFSLHKGTYQEKKQIKKRKVTKELEKPNNESVYDLTDKQKEIVKKNSIIKERILTIEKILEIYPNLKKDKKSIVDHVLGKKEVQKKCYILEKINVKNKNVYRDEQGNVINDKIELIGFWEQEKNGRIKYMFFSERKNLKAKMARNKRKILEMKV